MATKDGTAEEDLDRPLKDILGRITDSHEKAQKGRSRAPDLNKTGETPADRPDDRRFCSVLRPWQKPNTSRPWYLEAMLVTEPSPGPSSRLGNSGTDPNIPSTERAQNDGLRREPVDSTEC